LPWGEVLKDIDHLSGIWEGVKTSLSSRDGLERFIRAGGQDPFLERRLKGIQSVEMFLGHAESILFVHQYVTDQRLTIPAGAPYIQDDLMVERGIHDPHGLEDYSRLRKEREEIIRFFEEKTSLISPEALEEVFNKFRAFQDAYCRIYAEAHQRERGRERFEHY
jgi:hypothetical protein